MAGCGGCAERGAAIKAAAIAISEGRLADVKAEVERFKDVTRRDAGAALTAAKAKLGMRR